MRRERLELFTLVSALIEIARIIEYDKTTRIRRWYVGIFGFVYIRVMTATFSIVVG